MGQPLRSVGSGLLVLSLAVLGLALAWTVLLYGVTRETAQHDPEAAIRINDRDGFALARAAETQLALAESPADLRRAAALARRALIHAPLEGAPLRVLAHEAESDGRARQAWRLRGVLAARTRRDADNENWLFGAALNRRDYPAAIRHADALMRLDVNAAGRLAPVLVAVLNEPGAVGPIGRALAAGPSWRDAFLRFVTSEAAEPRKASLLLHSLASTRRPPTDYELRPLIGRLVEQGEYRHAYATWRAFLPPTDALGPIYDPDFTGAPGVEPFNWRLEDSAAGSAGIVHQGRQATLRVEIRGAGAEVLAEQLLILEPGRYRLSGLMLFSGDGLTEAPRWRVQCAAGGAPVAQSSGFRPLPGWRRFEMDFDVPAEGCEAQWLRLGAGAPEGFDAAEARFARLRLEHAG